MVPPKYDRHVYGVTPPRELDEDESDDSHSPELRGEKDPNSKSSPTTSKLDTGNVSDAATLLKARLQYAQLKIATGLSTENLQQIERAFISSPRQPRRPLPSEYPPTPAHSSPHSRKLKRLLLSAMTPTQNSWRKKKRIREQRKNEAIEDEAAARTILMLSSQSKTPPTLTPPRSVPSGSSSHGSPEDYRTRCYPPPVYYGNKEPPPPTMYEAVADIPNYDDKSREIAQSLPRRRVPQVVPAQEEVSQSSTSQLPPSTSQAAATAAPPPPAVFTQPDQNTGAPHQYYQYNRPLPPPPQYYYRPRPPPMYGRPLPEDPFHSTPIIQNNISASRHRSPPSPPQ